MEAKKGATALFHLLSPAFRNGGQIPQKLAGESPALAWTGQPAETQSFALIMEDIDAPGEPKVHWMLYGIGPDGAGVGAGIERKLNPANGLLQGKNEFGHIGYTGPNPPRGTSHRYQFTLYAWPKKFVLKPGADKREFRKAVHGAGVPTIAKLVGVFKSEGTAKAAGEVPGQPTAGGSVEESDLLPEAQRARLDSLLNDKIFRSETDRIENQLKEAYAANPKEVAAFFHRFSFTSAFTQQKVEEYLGKIVQQYVRRSLEDYVTYANRFHIQVRLKTDPLRFKKILWPEQGEKFHVRIVDDHLEGIDVEDPAEEESYADFFEAGQLKVLEPIQKLIDAGKAKYGQIEDRGNYSPWKDLVRVIYKDDGVGIFLYNAEQAYLGFIIGEKMAKQLLFDLGPSITEFQRKHYGRIPSGRPPKITSTKEDHPADQPATSTEEKAAASGNDGPKDTKATAAGSSGPGTNKKTK